MNWIASTTGLAPVNTDILVKFKNGAYAVLNFKHDSEYGYCAEGFETYYTWNEIEKYTLIEDDA